MRVIAPWIKHCTYGPQHTYIFPCRDSVLLGGVYQEDNYDESVSAADRASILERTAAYVPSLRGARIVEEGVSVVATQPP